jgi:hypothetical protein
MSQMRNIVPAHSSKPPINGIPFIGKVRVKKSKASVNIYSIH